MPRLTFFHLFYSTTFTLLSLLTLALVLVPPGDAIAQAHRRNNQLYNVFVIAGVYLLTAIIAVALYTARMYTFRRLLADIPKTRAPPPLPPRVRIIVSSALSRSAHIALTTRPSAASRSINHPGWAPPGADLKGVEYRAIIADLPALLEKEVRVSARNLDPSVVERPPCATLRQWLERLVGIQLVSATGTETFLALYERARFRGGGKGIEEGEFRALMVALGILLKSIRGEEEVGVVEGRRWDGTESETESMGYMPERVDSRGSSDATTSRRRRRGSTELQRLNSAGTFG